MRRERDGSGERERDGGKEMGGERWGKGRNCTLLRKM